MLNEGDPVEVKSPTDVGTGKAKGREGTAIRDHHRY